MPLSDPREVSSVTARADSGRGLASMRGGPANDSPCLPLRHQAICGGLGVGRRCSSCRRLDHGAAAAGAARDDRRFALSCGDAERTRDAAMKHVGTAAGVAAAAVAARAAAAAASAGGGAAAAAAAACHSLTRRVRSRQMPQRVHGAG
eukprot:357163-Chlamydomonas_euryale.AAC.5